MSISRSGTGSTGARSRVLHVTRTRSKNNFAERGPTMSKPRITFAQLRQLLLDVGFTETVTPKSHVFFAHEPSGAEVALPIDPTGLFFPITSSRSASCWTGKA